MEIKNIRKKDVYYEDERFTSVIMTDSVMRERHLHFKKDKNYMRLYSPEIDTYNFRELKELNRIMISSSDYYKQTAEFHKKFKDLPPVEAIGYFFDKIEKEENLFFDKLAFVIDYKGKSSRFDYYYYVLERIHGKVIVSVYSTKNGFGAKHITDFISYCDNNIYYYFNVFADKNHQELVPEKEVGMLGEAVCFIIYTLLEINKKLAHRNYTKSFVKNSNTPKTSSSKSKANTTSSTRKTIYKLDDLLNTKIYINNKDDFRLPRKYERHTDSWNVLGYYRHYKSGKVVFVKPHVRGDRSKKPSGKIIKLS